MISFQDLESLETINTIFNGEDPKKQHKQIVTVNLELDLLHMILWNRFLGENFIKCIFRYHAELPGYILELFC